MLCANCETQLPDEAIYCIKCGKPVYGGIEKPSETHYLELEIVKDVVKAKTGNPQVALIIKALLEEQSSKLVYINDKQHLYEVVYILGLVFGSADANHAYNSVKDYAFRSGWAVTHEETSVFHKNAFTGYRIIFGDIE